MWVVNKINFYGEAAKTFHKRRFTMKYQKMQDFKRVWVMNEVIFIIIENTIKIEQKYTKKEGVAFATPSIKPLYLRCFMRYAPMIIDLLPLAHARGFTIAMPIISLTTHPSFNWRGSSAGSTSMS